MTTCKECNKTIPYVAYRDGYDTCIACELRQKKETRNAIDVNDAIRQLRYVTMDCVPKRRFHIVDVAPENYRELVSAVTAGDLPILGKYSENTIFGDVYANILQRVLHDTIHLELHADTSVDGESLVAREQARIVEIRFGTQLANFVYADLYGQTLHNVKFGRFPFNQVKFTFDYVNTGKVNEW